MTNHTDSIRRTALQCLLCADPDQKMKQVESLYARSLSVKDETAWGRAEVIRAPLIGVPGHPVRPELVPPQLVGRRGLHTVEGRAALIHALTHIEFNAINLALDICWRFANLPQKFYEDWLKVAAEEAYHFKLLRNHLATLTYQYGDFTAHNGLWVMAEKTQDDVLARLALVPRTLEARGLDVTPAIRNKLEQIGDAAGAAILDIILRDEIGHVAIGNHWYHAFCEQAGIDPITTYPQLAAKYQAPVQRGPFNVEARKAAGFTADELAQLKQTA